MYIYKFVVLQLKIYSRTIRFSSNMLFNCALEPTTLLLNRWKLRFRYEATTDSKLPSNLAIRWVETIEKIHISARKIKTNDETYCFDKAKLISNFKTNRKTEKD